MVRRSLALVASLLFASSTFAQTTCYQYKIQSNPGGHASVGTGERFLRAEQACARAVARKQTDIPSIPVTLQSQTHTGKPTAPHNLVCTVQWAGGAGTAQYTFTTEAMAECVVEPCDTTTPGLGVGDKFTSTTNPGSGASYCHLISHCLVTVESALQIDGSTLYTWHHTTSACTPTATESAQSDTGENCIEGTGGGVEFCSAGPPDDAEDQNCGFVNGEFMCLGKVEDDGCAVGSSGARACGENAPTPPAPDNGTPGTKAAPDETITININNETITVEYFNETTVSNSNRPPGTSGDNPYDGQDDGDGTGGNASQGSGGEGIDDDGCTEADGCTGSLPALGEVACETFGGCASAFYARVSAAPILAAVSNVGDSFPSGSCPTVNVTMFGETNSLAEPMCDLWSASIAPFLGVFFLICYAWISTRIVLSA